MSLEAEILKLAQAVGSDVKSLLAALANKQPILGYKITVSQTEPPSPSVGDVWISY